MNDYQKNCIFCKIVSKEIPSSIFYEDDNFLCFLDINPMTLGHSLLLPKGHYTWMQEAPEQIISEIFIIAKKIMKNMIKNLNCDYVQVSVIGKDVPHFHVHLIPRLLTDKLPHFETVSYKNDQEKNEFISKLKN